MRLPKKNFSSHAIVLLAYSLLTIVFTYPLAFRIGSALPGIAPDTYVYIWNLEWVRRAIFELGTNPFFTREMYYPSGVSLYLSSLILGNDLLALPLQFAFGAVSAYMLMTLAMFVLSGYGGYLLAYELVRERGAAFFAGMVFTFSPYHLAHLLYSHFDLMPLQWLPLFALALKKLFDRPSFSYWLLALVFLLWTSITAWYYALYALLLFAFYTMYRVARARNWRLLPAAFSLGIIYLALVSPSLVPMYNERADWPSSFRGVEEAERFSANLLSFVTPSSYQTFWGSVFAPVASTFNGGPAERTLFLGYTTIALAMVALTSRVARRRELFFWLGAALFFLVVSLGPILRVGGISEFGPDHTPIYLPYALLLKLPLVSNIFVVARSISRFAVMAVLGFAVLAAFGLRQLSARFRIAPTLITPVACALVGLEFITVPLWTTLAQVPAAVVALAEQRDDFAVLDLPVDYRTGGEALYFSLASRKPTMNGYHARLLPKPGIDGTPALRGLLEIPDSRDILLEPELTPAQVLSFFKVRYITLHKQTNAPAALAESARWIQDHFGNLAPMSDDPKLALYAVPDSAPPPRVVSFAEGWYEPEQLANGTTFRWMQNDARILIYSRQAEPVEVEFTAASFAQPRRLQIYLNGALLSRLRIPSDDVRSIALPQLALQPGANELRLHSIEPPESASGAGASHDERLLSIVFSQLRVRTATSALQKN